MNRDNSVKNKTKKIIVIFSFFAYLFFDSNSFTKSNSFCFKGNKVLFLQSEYNFSQNQMIIGFVCLAIIIFILLLISTLLFVFLKRKKQKLKKLELQVLDYQKQLDELKNIANHFNREKDEFLTNMSYDFRTPLNGIIGSLDLAKIHPDDIDNLRFSLKSIREITLYLLKLTDDMLAISKTESIHLNLDEEAFDVNDLVDECSDIVESQITKKEQELSVIKNVTNSNLFGASLHIRRIILNILDNAIKFTPKHGHIVLSIDELPSNDVKKAIIKITIQDDGVGISEEFQKDIFKPFCKENNSNSSNGTGLGMAITKKLVDLLEGTITVQSNLNVGSTFTIILPIKINFDENAKETSYEEVTSLNGVRILLVEDNDFNREIAKTLLEDKNAIIEEAKNGLEAYEMLSKSEFYHYDIILMDIMMPIMNGIEATKKIRALNRKDAEIIPIFAMTANAFDDDVILTKSVGMNEHFSKPLSINDILSALSKYVSKYDEKKKEYLDSINKEEKKKYI